MHNNITSIYSSPQDVMRPLTVFLEAVQFLQLDPDAKELTSYLVEYATDMARAHTLVVQEEVRTEVRIETRAPNRELTTANEGVDNA